MPEFDKVEQHFLGSQVDVQRVDAEADPAAAKAVGVMSYPAIFLYKADQKIPYEGEFTADAIQRFVELS